MLNKDHWLNCGERLDGAVTNDRSEEQDLGKIISSSFDMLRLRCLRNVQEAQDKHPD